MFVSVRSLPLLRIQPNVVQGRHGNCGSEFQSMDTIRVVPQAGFLIIGRDDVVAVSNNFLSNFILLATFLGIQGRARSFESSIELRIINLRYVSAVTTNHFIT